MWRTSDQQLVSRPVITYHRYAGLWLFFSALPRRLCGEVPPLDVTVFDPSSKVAFKGSLSANSTFATGNLRPGNYVVQFN